MDWMWIQGWMGHFLFGWFFCGLFFFFFKYNLIKEEVDECALKKSGTICQAFQTVIFVEVIVNWG